MSVIEGYAYALIVDGVPMQPWITGEDGALRQVNLDRFVHRHEREHGGHVSVAQIFDQRIRKVMVQYPATAFSTDGERIFAA